MALSKRLRFEILRRDNHTCQYCGNSAPDVKLHVDHVRPKTLGGTDSPENLVTACKDCNAGKTSSSLDAPLVAAIAQRNLDWELRAATLSAQMRGTLERDKMFLEGFNYWWEKCEDAVGKAPLPFGYEASIYTWSGMGVPEDSMEAAVTAAFAAGHVAPEGRFKYLAGILWNQIKGHTLELEPSQPSLYTESDLERSWSEGFDRATRRMFRDFPKYAARYDPLSLVVDGQTTPYIDAARWGEPDGA